MARNKSPLPVALIVEDRSTFDLLERLRPNIDVRFASHFEDAVAQLKDGGIDIVVADVALTSASSEAGSDNGNLLDVIKTSESLEHKPAFILASSTRSLHVEDGHNLLNEPSASELLDAIKRAAERREGNITAFHTLYEDQSGLILPKSGIVTAAWDFQNALESISKNPLELIALTPRQFEELVAGIWDRFGYEVELTSATGDGGRDVIALRRSEAQVRFLIECKRYSPERKVGVTLVRALLGVKTSERATKAILATTSAFTRPAEKLLQTHLWELEGRNFDGLMEWIKMATHSKGD